MAKKRKIIEKRVDFCESCNHIGNLYNIAHDTGKPFMGVCEIDGFSKIISKHYCDKYKRKRI